MSAPQPLHFRYAYDGRGEAAFADYVLHEYSQLHAVERVRSRHRWPNVLLASLLFIALGIFLERVAVHESIVMGVILGVALWIPYCFYVFRAAGESSNIKALKQRREAANEKPAQAVELTLDEAGVRLTYDAGETLQRWKVFTEIIVLDTHIIIAYADYFGGVSIPRGVFESDQHLQQSLDTMRAWLLHFGVDDTSRIREFLATRHVRCSCGQDLHGLTTATCPECGTTWRYNALSMHAYVQDPKAPQSTINPSGAM
jgi:hypothetical protein